MNLQKRFFCPSLNEIVRLERMFIPNLANENNKEKPDLPECGGKGITDRRKSRKNHQTERE